MRATVSSASASGMPNFWSSRAVARYSCVEACTPELMRSRTGCTRPAARAAAATRSISIRLSTTIVPTPTATARSISAMLLLLPWNPSSDGSVPAASATASSPPLATSSRRPASVIHRAISVERNALPA